MILLALKKAKSQIAPLKMSRVSCRKCGDTLTEETMTKKEVSKKGKQYYLNRCRTCIVEADILLRRLKRENPMPPSGSECTLCVRISKLFCDHDHATDQFRGWICKTCNCSIGGLGDSEEGVRKALTYLEKARSKQRSRSPTVNKDDEPNKPGSVDMAPSRTDNK